VLFILLRLRILITSVVSSSSSSKKYTLAVIKLKRQVFKLTLKKYFIFQASPEEHKIEDELCGQNGVDLGMKNRYVNNNGDSEMSSKDIIQEEVLERNMVPPFVVDFVLSTDENTTHMPGRTSLDAKKELEINEDVNPALTINVPPFSTAFARVKSTDDNIMDKEKTTVQTGTSSNDENVITMDNNRSDIQTNEQHDNEIKLIITFNESEICKILEQYHQRVRKDLRHLHPSPEVLELSQRSLRGFHIEIPRGESGIPIPVPYIYHRNNGDTSSAMKVCKINIQNYFSR